jgi:hypothetical protein
MELDQIRHKLSLFIDGQLGSEENEKIRKLIDSDSVWREEHRKLIQLEQMAERFEITGDDKYWEENRERILDKIDRAESEKIIPVKRFSRRSDIYKLVAVAASMALVIFISIYETDDFGQIEEIFSPKESAKPAVMEPALKQDTAFDIAKPIESKDAEEGEVRKKDKAPEGKPEAMKISLQERDEVVPSSIVDQIQQEIVPVAPSSTESPVQVGIESTGEMFEPPIIDQPVEKEISTDIKPDVVPSAVLSEPAAKIKGTRETIEFQMNSVDKVALEELAESTDDVLYKAMPDKIAMPVDTILDYSFWKARVDSLEKDFYSLMSAHYASDSDRDEGKSISDFTGADYLEIAEAFYMLGRLTDNEKEKKTMITRLQKLAEMTDSDKASRINEYLNSLVR